MRSISSLALRNTASAGATSAAQRGVQVGVGELVLVEVEHVDERLGRQQARARRRGEVDPGGRARGIQGVALLEDLLRRERVLEERLGLLLDPRLLLEARHGLLEGLEVGEDRARCGSSRCRTRARPCRRRGRRRRPRRRAPPGRWRRPRGCWRGTCCPAPHPPRRRARCRRCRRTTPSRAGSSPSRRSRRAGSAASSGSGTTPDVGLDRRERVVRREDVVLGQGVEHRGLADVRESDDSDGEGHGAKSLPASRTRLADRGRRPHAGQGLAVLEVEGVLGLGGHLEHPRGVGRDVGGGVGDGAPVRARRSPAGGRARGRARRCRGCRGRTGRGGRPPSRATAAAS